MVRRLVSPNLVGRRRELAVAAEMLERTRRGRSSHLLVAGEAGVGKTRFAEAVAESAATNGFRVLRGGCVQLGSGELPYAPIAEALRTMARDLDPKTLAAVVADDGSTLARIVPALGPRAASDAGRSRFQDVAWWLAQDHATSRGVAALSAQPVRAVPYPRMGPSASLPA